ncbi:MAG: L-serine ammonia-lyase, iron-sulfur-dependent, subunit alpha [Spirochaetaceae bacterium]|nr:L-serine ammonia-lyase, iron-sulfur-dependent, subunit alpha [Spirochaetaceae bacterium]MCF7950958.1 L-serine ammonia-lyase, iron-sulfur-dependent, subunit alpha [Spirochaetaceae bacterium]
MLTAEKALEFVRNNVFDTIGCTEPVAIAYAATAAYQHLGGTIESVEVSISVNVFKNAMAVGIPGSDKKGIQFAVALGLVAGDWNKQLRLFEGVKPEHLEEAGKLASAELIPVSLADVPEKIYIYTKVKTEKGVAEAEIVGAHDNLTSIKVNGSQVFPQGDTNAPSPETTDDGQQKNNSTGSSGPADPAELEGLSMEELVKAVQAIPVERLTFLSGAVDINVAAAEIGLKNAPGMGLGAGIERLKQRGAVGNSLATRVEQYVAAAADSRMSGMMVPIKGCGGSGNHGIAYFLGTGLAFREYEQEMQSSLEQTLAMGLLLIRYIKVYTGLLTPTCGVTVSAAPAIAASLVFAMGGTPEQMTAAVKLVLGNIAGILCDGAKHGCALKAATSARFGVQAALLALDGVTIPDSDGIVGRDLSDSMNFLRQLQNKGLTDADKTMLEILMEKSERIAGS